MLWAGLAVKTMIERAGIANHNPVEATPKGSLASAAMIAAVILGPSSGGGRSNRKASLRSIQKTGLFQNFDDLTRINDPVRMIDIDLMTCVDGVDRFDRFQIIHT